MDTGLNLADGGRERCVLVLEVRMRNFPEV
jgi:hypothetical protein